MSETLIRRDEGERGLMSETAVHRGEGAHLRAPPVESLDTGLTRVMLIDTSGVFTSRLRSRMPASSRVCLSTPKLPAPCPDTCIERTDALAAPPPPPFHAAPKGRPVGRLVRRTEPASCRSAGKRVSLQLKWRSWQLLTGLRAQQWQDGAAGG